MNDEELQSKLEEHDIKPEIIDEILINLKKDDGISIPSGLSLDDRIFLLKITLDNETDFRKRARIAARIISERI